MANGASHAIFISLDASSANIETLDDLESITIGVKNLREGTQVDVNGIGAVLDSLEQ